jgi:hypothetical protein
MYVILFVILLCQKKKKKKKSEKESLNECENWPLKENTGFFFPRSSVCFLGSNFGHFLTQKNGGNLGGEGGPRGRGF